MMGYQPTAWDVMIVLVIAVLVILIASVWEDE